MKKIVFILVASFVLVSCSGEKDMTDMSSDRASNMSEEMSMTEDSEMIMDHSPDKAMVDDASSKEALSDSPRHQEWVKIDNN